MNTIYVFGKKGFRAPISKQLSRTCKVCLPGDMLEHHEGTHECQVYWIPENLELQKFKRQIGSVLVFKYRLQFFTSADEYYKRTTPLLTNTFSDKLSDEEIALMNSFRNRIKSVAA